MHLSQAQEDYLEAILFLIKNNQEARSRDIAQRLNVHKSTVTAALKSLSEAKLINYEPYKAITLTEDGEKKAQDVTKRHQALRTFFIEVLGVAPDIAEQAACGMEHSVHKDIINRMIDFIECLRIPRGGGGGNCWLEKLRATVNENSHGNEGKI